MTERERQLIEAYIPSPRDPSLDFDEYYVKEDSTGRIYKVHICDINPSRDEDTVYGVYTDGGKRIRYWTNDGDFPKRAMYDNKQDCRDGTHDLYGGWEHLREIQRKEEA